MKKISLISAVVLLAFASCNREPSKPGVDNSCFQAQILSEDGKTFLSKNNIFWSRGDEIAVFAEGIKYKFTLSEGESASRGTFSGEELNASQYFAIYPYSENTSLNGSVITTEIPQYQTYRLNSTGAGQNVMVACSNDHWLSFRNISSLLKFEILSSNIGEITITGNNGEELAGTVDISFTEGIPVCTVKEGVKSVVLKSGDKPFEPGVYYAAVLPNTFTKGITITLKPYVWAKDNVVLGCNTTSSYVKTSSNECVAHRSHIVPLGCIDKDAVWTYSNVSVNCLRDTGNNYGQYVDLNTGRTFFAIGAYKFCEEIDLAFMQWTGAGFCSIQSPSTLSIVNSTNLGRYGLPIDSTNDIASNWPNRNVTNLCYLPDMTDSQWENLTAAGIEDIYLNCTPVVQYFANMDGEGINLTNERIQSGKQKYCVFRTGNADEGIIAGVMKFTGVYGVAGAWKVDFDYKYVSISGDPGFKPDPEPIKPLDSGILEDPYGVCANPAAGDEKQYGLKEVEQIKAMGANWIREDLTWGWINSSVGNWNYTYMDNNASYAMTAGVNILPIMCYDQSWATPLADHIDEWLDYVTRVVNRYKKQIRVWEVYNEPNHKNYWHNESPNAARYTAVLKATYECIKEIDPDLYVLFGGLAGTAFDYAESCLKAGAGNYFDAMNYHPYNITGKPEKLISDVSKMREILTKYGFADKPLWITEIGWTTPVPLVANGVSEEAQAQYVPRTFMIAFAGGVGKVFWFQYRSPEKRESSDPDFYRDHYGLVHKDLAVKPSYNAYKVLTTMLPSGSTKPVLTSSGSIYLCHWQNPDGEDVWAYWSGADTISASLSITGNITSACDLFGQAVSISAGNVSVKPDVTYVVGPTALTLK